METTNKKYFEDIEKITSKFPLESFACQWISGGQYDPVLQQEEVYYAHIIVLKKEFRSEIINILEEYLSEDSCEIDGYVVGRVSIAIVPKVKDGPEIGRNIVTCDV